MNRFFLLILLIILGTGPITAQFSFQTRYHTNPNNDQSAWPAHAMVDGSVHYWTRLKKYRVEFYPGVLIQSHQTKEDGSNLNLGLSLPIAFYPLDFVNDCDCPTFSKNSFWFQKGFFIRLTSSWSTKIEGSTPDTFDQLLGTGASIGLDFGVSDLVTISPMLGYTRLFSLSENDNSGSYLHFGFSVLFRNDYRNRYR